MKDGEVHAATFGGHNFVPARIGSAKTRHRLLVHDPVCLTSRSDRGDRGGRGDRGDAKCLHITSHLLQIDDTHMRAKGARSLEELSWNVRYRVPAADEMISLYRPVRRQRSSAFFEINFENSGGVNIPVSQRRGRAYITIGAYLSQNHVPLSQSGR